MVFAKKQFFFIAKNVLYYNVYYVCSLSNNYCCTLHRKLNIYLLNILTSKLPNYKLNSNIRTKMFVYYF